MAQQPVGVIVVGIDGSGDSDAAVRFAADLAGAFDAEVVAVHALGLLDQLEPGGPRVPAQPHRDEIRAKVEGEWIRPLADAGVRHRAALHDGNPVDVVLQVAEEVGGDLIVVGSRGVGGSPIQLLGSTSTQIAQQARGPVVIVPADRSGGT